MTVKKIVAYLLLAVLLALVLTFLTFATPLGRVLQYTSLAFLMEPWAVGRGERGMGIMIYFVLGVNFIWGLLPFVLACIKSRR